MEAAERRDKRTDSGQPPEAYPELTVDEIKRVLGDLETQLSRLETEYALGLEECRADLETFRSKHDAGEWWARVGGRSLSSEIASLTLAIDELRRV
jgi:hypothetical protein